MPNTEFNFGHERSVAGMETGDVDEFLGHRSRDRSSDLILRSSEWKKDSKLDLWLHTRGKIAAVWGHALQKVVQTKPKDGKPGEKVVLFNKWNCHEDEKPTLKGQFRRDARGNRVHPPRRCPQCILGELLREMCIDEELSWVDPILKFEGDDRSKTVIYRAGDFWGAFTSRDLSTDEIGDMRRAGVNQREAWRTSLPAKCSYIFVGADNDDLAAGCRILIEGDALGQAMQRAIERERDRTGSKDLGNPFKHPYAFRWTYDDSQEFSKKYDALALGIPCTEEVLAVIRDADPPDISDQVARGNVDELRALIEGHLVEGARAKVLPLLDKAFPPRDPAAAKPKDPPADGDDGPPYECNHCGKKVLGADDMACPACGATYEVADIDGAKTIVLATRPCLGTGCKAQVRIAAEVGPEHKATCKSCGAVHHEEAISEDGKNRIEWFLDTVAEPKPAEPAKPARARRSR